MNYFLYNPSANNGNAIVRINEIRTELADQNIKEINLLEFKAYATFVQNLTPHDKIYLAGGDGTLNRFVNAIDCENLKNDIYYYAVGTGNDFLHDLEVDDMKKCVKINHYVRHLPVVTVNGESYKFFNGIGYGIDGYCCEEGDKQRAKNKKKINYTAIAMKGLMGKFKPRKCTINIDGFVKNYKDVWLAPTMLGRYYGGGMKVTPDQYRDNNEHVVSLAVMFGSGKIKTLTRFPNIFSGKHVRFKDMVEIFKGHNVNVKFDEPCALQVDGETFLNVSEYSVTYN